MRPAPRPCGRRAAAATAARAGRFLAMAFTPACRSAARARRRRREADAPARRWAEERRQAERELQRATPRLRIVALFALLALRATLGAGEAARVLLWPSPRRGLARRRFLVRRRRSITSGRVDHALHARHLGAGGLEVRRHAFFAAVVLCVAHCAALVAWWRFLWYALGAFCSDHLGLASLDAARCRVALLRLEESSEARFAWLRAVAAERRESLGLLTAPDITVGDDVTLHATSLHIAAAFHAGPDDALPQNPHRGLDDDDDALPAILHEVLGTEKKRGPAEPLPVAARRRVPPAPRAAARAGGRRVGAGVGGAHHIVAARERGLRRGVPRGERVAVSLGH